MHDYWTIPREWTGQTVFILAGGPSLMGFDADQLRGHGKIITINNSFQLCHWADVLYFCDRGWWYKHRDEILDVFVGGCVVALEQRELPGMHSLRNSGRTGLETKDRAAIRTGGNSGYQAIGLAYHLGAARIVLLGYDLHCARGRTHWHGGHHGTQPGEYERRCAKWRRNFATLVEPLAVVRVEIVNATPGSALDCWPRKSLMEVIG